MSDYPNFIINKKTDNDDGEERLLSSNTVTTKSFKQYDIDDVKFFYKFFKNFSKILTNF